MRSRIWAIALQRASRVRSAALHNQCSSVGEQLLERIEVGRASWQELERCAGGEGCPPHRLVPVTAEVVQGDHDAQRPRRRHQEWCDAGREAGTVDPCRLGCIGLDMAGASSTQRASSRPGALSDQCVEQPRRLDAVVARQHVRGVSARQRVNASRGARQRHRCTCATTRAAPSPPAVRHRALQPRLGPPSRRPVEQRRHVGRRLVLRAYAAPPARRSLRTLHKDEARRP
jgi:hypothetical protein